MKTAYLCALVFAFLTGVPGHADFKEVRFRQLQLEKLQKLSEKVRRNSTGSTRVGEFAHILQTTQAYIFDQKINHANPDDTRTFKQRYWVNSTYAKSPEAPIVLWLCGEWTCSARELSRISYYASLIGAHMVAMEHRYYGTSQPFPSLTTENLKYLTVEAALQDFAAIQRHLTDLGVKGKAIVVGGSYSASLAAYYRMMFPELTLGAWASSGPVQAKENFEEYDYHNAMTAGPECAEAMRVVTRAAEASLDNPEKLADMKKIFMAEMLDDPVDFLYSIADMGALAMQYGYRDQFCKMITSGDPIQGYADFTKMIYQSWAMTAKDGSAEGAVSTDPNDYPDTNMRAWFYQDCTQYGYWQVAYHDPAITVRSTKINLAYHRDICKRLFGMEVKAVDTDTTNKSLYQPLLDPKVSNILFTNGSQDPWSTLSITAELGNNTNPNTTVFLIDGAAHCDDLGGKNSPALQQARALARDLMAKWAQ